jgi:hypothetical protein
MPLRDRKATAKATRIRFFITYWPTAITAAPVIVAALKFNLVFIKDQRPVEQHLHRRTLG